MMRLVPVALIVLVATAAHADERLEKLVAGLRAEASSEAYAAYNALRQERSPALIGLLVDVLPACSDMGQYYGVLLLQQNPDRKRVVAALRKLLRASSVHLRVLAAAQLHRFGERDVAGVIVKALREPDLTPVRQALLLTRIYSIRDEAVLAVVRDFLKPDGHPDVVAQALYDVYLVRDQAAQEAVRGLDAHADAGVRTLAAACLLVLGDPQGAERLVAALEAGGPGTRQAYRLRNLLNAVKPLSEAILAALLARLEAATDVNEVRALIDLLAEHGYAKSVRVIRKLLEHENAVVSKAAFSALTKFPGAITPEAMRDLLAGDDDARRLAAVEALRRADDVSGLPVALAILKTGKNDADRWEAARVLGGFRSTKVVGPLLDALMDHHATVRSNAFHSLGAVLRSLFPYRRFDLATTGYGWTASEASRRAAVAKLRTWWKQNRGRDW